MNDPIPRLSPTEAAILRLLVDGGEQYGLQLVQSSDGELRRGSIYVLLHRLEEKGYVTSRDGARPAGDGPPRRLYKPSGLGQRVLGWMEKGAALVPAGAR